MKSKLFLTVLSLAVLIVIGILTGQFMIPRTKEVMALKAQLEDDLKILRAEEERIEKLPLPVQSLVGIKGIWVLVDYIYEDTRSMGWDGELFRADVESKLRLAGIKVNSREEWGSSEDRAYLGVYINTNIDDDGPSMAYDVRVEFYQRVTLVRSPAATVDGRTWGRFRLLRCPKSKFPEMSLQEVRDGVDEFISTYFLANPGKNPALYH